MKSRDGSIDATFRIDNGVYIQGSIDGKDRKRIDAFYNDERVKNLMKEMWNKSKDDRRRLD